MDMRNRNNTWVVLMPGLLCLLGWIFLRVPDQFLASPGGGYRKLTGSCRLCSARPTPNRDRKGADGSVNRGIRSLTVAVR